MGVVYALLQPETSQIRYVGKTSGPPERRLAEPSNLPFTSVLSVVLRLGEGSLRTPRRERDDNHLLHPE